MTQQIRGTMSVIRAPSGMQLRSSVGNTRNIYLRIKIQQYTQDNDNHEKKNTYRGDNDDDDDVWIIMLENEDDKWSKLSFLLLAVVAAAAAAPVLEVEFSAVVAS